MNNRKIVLSLFIIVALAQLYVPARMILDREKVLEVGVEYKFKTRPIDPTDPFRGKYITLSFEENSFEVQSGENWESGEEIYLLLKTDYDGYAKIQSVSKQEPGQGPDFLKARVNYVSGGDPQKLFIDYPFDRYYMEESKAYEAELAYRETQRDSAQTAYALVSIKEGEAVLKDVLIDGVPIREIVLQERGNME